MSEMQKKVCRALGYFEHFPVFVSAASECVSISVFTSFVGAPVDIASSAVGLKLCVNTTLIKKYKSFIKKKREKHDYKRS